MDSYSTNTNTERKASFNFENNKDTASFLNELSLGQYTQTFIDEGFESLRALCEITEADLIALNVKRGHRRVIQRGIATLNGVPQDQPLMLGVVPTNNNITNITTITSPKLSTGCNSSEGSYTTSGYGSMNSTKHPTASNSQYESSNSSQYTSTSSNSFHKHHPRQQSRLHLESSSGDNEKAHSENNDDNNSNNNSNNSFNKGRADGVRSSSFSSNDEEGNGDDGQNVLKRKYRRHPKPDKNAPIKPPSAYIMFSNDARAELNKNHNMTFVEIAKIVGDQWKNLGHTQKQRYEKIAMRAKDEYLDALNAYRQTDEYKNYQTYLNNFKSEQDATNRKIARLRKKAKRESPSSGSMAGSSSNGNSDNIKNRRSDISLGSSNSTDYGDNARSSSSSGSTDIYKAHLRNNPPLPSIITTTREIDSPPTIEEAEEETNNGDECYSPQQKAPPPVDESVTESTYRLPFNDTATTTAS